MPRYLFTITISGEGDNPDEAWNEAIDGFAIDPGETPEKFEIDENRKMYALVTTQGTACYETALCERCVVYPINKDQARGQILSVGDITDKETFVDCGHNVALSCIICGFAPFEEE